MWRDNERGFTLTELLIIMAILGILAGIVVFSIKDVSEQSATQACRSSFKVVETAVEAYKSDVGSSPLGLDSLTRTTSGLTSTTVGPWLKDAPPVYAPGASPSITGGAPYGFFIDSATGLMAVGTLKNDGAKSDSGMPAVDGDFNCSEA